MIAIFEKSEHNIDFHQIVDFIEASYIRIKTMNEGTKILATVDGKPRTISESLIRRNLKLNDEEGISSLPDAELFENLALMGYNILPNQRFTFQKDLQRKQTHMATKIEAQDLEISNLKARIKLLEDKDRGSAEPSGDDASIKRRSMEIGEEARVERSTEPGSNDTEEMVNVLISMEAANILTSRVAAVSVPHVAGVSTVGVPIVTKDKGKEKVVELEEPKKKKVQEQIDAQVAKEIEEEITREDQRMNEQLARDAEIARLHAEEEPKMMIEGLDRSNEMIEKHLQEYEQSEAELTIGEKIELINKLVKYQDHHAKILKYQAQQSKPLSKKEQREFYMSVLRSHAGWKTRHFREERERVKRKGLKLEQGSAKKMKTSEEVSEEDLKGMMQLVPVEEVYVEALQVKRPIID
uniref:Uncharacterized protein n=1 Tax=Tanacetum cinerariifolium TaxID=118510 RepID=A0A699I154_TANCI|nr:hypothetical protein [Tanacetum cinerariifolium]